MTTTKPIAWSHSSLNRFLSCGKMYYHINVAKDFREEKSEQLLWGERVHKFMEQCLLRNDTRTEQVRRRIENDVSLEIYRPIAERFAATAGNLTTERQLAITNAFQPTGWFAHDVWCRGVLDACWLAGNVARVVDWKTGRRKQDNRQLMLFALLIFAHHPEIERVNTAFVWLQSGKIDTEKFHRSDLPKLWQEFLPDVRRMEYAYKTQTWIPKPSGLCSWCPVRSCTFWDGKSREVQREAATTTG